MQETLRLGGAEQLELGFPEELPAPRCGSCGAPIAHGDLCDACEQAFRSVLVGAPRPAADPDAETTQSASAPDIAAGPEFAPVEPAAAVKSEAGDTTAEAPPSLKAGAAPEADAIPSIADTTRAAAAPNRNRAAVAMVGAVAIAAVVGLPAGARWLANQRRSQIVAVQTAAQMPQPAPAVHRQKSTRAEAVAPEPERPAAAAPTASRSSSAMSARPPRPRAAMKSPAVNPVPVPAAVASTAFLTELAPVTPPPPPTVQPAPEPRMVAAEAPVGRFFDPSEVDEAPRIATRVAPQLPANLTAGSNDVVVVRILVSHTGHPFRINLLRRSRLGTAADDAVIAAVRHWTFSPARRHGEAVSCWYNFGVSLVRD